MNSAIIADTAASEAAPSKASTAAHWVKAAAHDEVLIISVSIRSASWTGMAPKPSRQPHMAQALESPSISTHLSAIPSIE